MRWLSASWVVPGGAPPLPEGVVVLDDAGVVREVRARAVGEAVERFDGVLLPGLVNAHTHLEGTAFAGRVGSGGGFAAFGRAYVTLARATAPEAIAAGVVAGVDALVAAGTALVGDVSNTLLSVPALVGSPLHAGVFHEVLGAPIADRIAEARAAQAALGTLPARVNVALAAHAPYSSPPALIQESYRTADAAGSLTSLHVAEHPEERQFLRDGSGPMNDLFATLGFRPDFPIPRCGSVEYLAGLATLGPAALAVHITDATAAERTVLRRQRAQIVLCPRSNDHIGGRLPDLPAILGEGFRPALGTDSLASSPSLDVLHEAQAFLRVYPHLSPSALVAMCTVWGAAAMRRATLGALVPGRAPGVLLAETDASPDDPERWLVEKAPPRRWIVPPGGAA